MIVRNGLAVGFLLLGGTALSQLSGCSACSRDDSGAAPALAASSTPQTLPLSPSHPPNSAAADRLQQSCAKMCDHSKKLSCKHPEECMPGCLAMGASATCSEQFAALFGCLSEQPLANWECDEDGVAAIREGFCNSEQGNAVACLETKQ